jgi:hypothetical protein
MSTNIPPHVVAALDQRHAQADAALADLIDRLASQGITVLDAPERTIGATVLLGRLPHTTVITIAAAAVARLTADTPAHPIPCPRCEGTGSVHVTTYGGHTVDCGMCRGTGTKENEF